MTEKYLGINIDKSRDKDLPEQGYALLTRKGFYKKEHETSPQQSFARAATCYSYGDLDLAQRIYDAASKHWFTFASPVLSNAVEHKYPSKLKFEGVRSYLEDEIIADGLPISCYLSHIPDTKEGLVKARSEMSWLSMMGGGIGLHAGMRSPDDKSTGVMSHLKGYDADALSYKQTACYTPDMEVLTGRGWVKFDQTETTDTVATLNTKGAMHFEKPEEWLEYEYDGEIVQLTSNRKGLELKVTPNHNLIISRYRKDGWSDYEAIEASDLKLHNEIKFSITSGYSSSTECCELTPMERLKIAHQADGHNYKQGQQIGFHFSKQRKIERLRSILRDCEVDYTETGTETRRFYVKHRHLPKDLNWISVEDTSAAKARMYLEEISHWDGHIKEDGKVDFSSASLKDVEKVQVLAVLAGWGSSSICKQTPKKSHWSTMYSITVKVRGHFLAEKLDKKLLNYTGKVYCCTVSTGIIMIRAGKSPLVCGNSRRGSIGAYLDVDHPEIQNFMNMRNPVGGDPNKKCFNLNNAVNITDEFMEKVVHGENFQLIDPKHGETGRYLNAREVWEQLLELRKETGEPYLNFIDTVNKAKPPAVTNPAYRVKQSNLCNEIHLFTDDQRTAVCCLSSLNLEKFDEWKDSGLVGDLVKFLDNVLEYFIAKAPDVLERAVYSAEKERAIGIGTLGFHSYLQSKNMPFEGGGLGSAAQVNYNLYKAIKDQAVEASKTLGAERGSPEDCEGSGMRNSHLLAIAPNASSSSLVNVSPSIEVFSANAFTSQGRAGTFLIKNKHLQKVLEKYLVGGQQLDGTWKSIIDKDGSVQHLGFLSAHEKKVFKTASEIDQRWVIEHASTRQPLVCQGQSVNLHVAPDIDKQAMSDLHMLAWKRELKGLYYCRTTSKVKAKVSSDNTQPLNAVKVDTSFETCLSCEG